MADKADNFNFRYCPNCGVRVILDREPNSEASVLAICPVCPNSYEFAYFPIESAIIQRIKNAR